jgi:hypothetical protein
MSTEPTRDTTSNRTRTTPRAGARTTTRRDPWTVSDDTDPLATAKAPRTFDPLCTRRLRNCCDERNAAQLEE